MVSDERELVCYELQEVEMALVFVSRFAVGTKVESEAFITKFNRIERYLNGRMSHDSVSYSKATKSKQRWVKSQHIFKPEFYGSPDPRIEATSGIVHHRFAPSGRLYRSVHHGLRNVGVTSYGESSKGRTSTAQHARGHWQRQKLWPERHDAHAGQWQTIRGMGVTLYNDGGVDGSLTRDVMVTGSCSAWEVGSSAPDESDMVDGQDPPSFEEGAKAAYGPERVECARLSLWVDGVLEGSSVRRIFTSRGEKWVHKNFMWTHTFEATPGYHNVEFRMKILKRFKAHIDPPDRWWRIVVDSRSMVVDMQNFRETDTTTWPE